MKECSYCGRKLKNLILADEEEDEKTYLCRKCHNEQNKKLREKIDHTRRIFGKP